jgi:hypothetical protein
MAGPSIGGILIAIGGSVLAFALDAATFAVSATCLWLMRPVASSQPEDEAVGSVWEEFKEGMSYVRGNVWLWGTFLAATFAYLLFIGPTEVLLPW